ncbi:MAG: trehalose-phosphatase [Deltaproteobacteria bacterium]
MIPALRQPCQRLLATHRRGGRVVLLFDYDGTLVPIVEHPRLAVLPPENRRVLADLARVPRVHLGIISGRQLADLRRIVDLPGIYFAGTSGLELDFDGVQVMHPSSGEIVPLLRQLSDGLGGLAGEFPGAWLEHKPLGLTVHFRKVRTSLTGGLRERVTEIVSSFSGRFRLVESSLSLEITPDLGWTKGTAVRMLVDSVRAPDVRVLYAGDSANDDEAMVAVADDGGITVGVGAEAPAAANVRVRDPGDLFEFLAAFAEALSACRVSHSLRPGGAVTL